MSATHAGIVLVELTGVEPGGNAEVVAHVPRDQSVHTEAHLAPGGGDDPRLDFIALDAVESRRLMRLIEDAERNQEKPPFTFAASVKR